MTTKSNYACIALIAASLIGVTVLAETAPTTAPSSQAPSTQPSAEYGPGLTLKDSDAVDVEAVLAKPADFDGKLVRFTGIVSSVCPTKGCWLRVQPEPGSHVEGDVFVKFKDPPEGRLIPMAAVGHDITVEGVIKDGQMSEAQAKHLKQDAGAPQADIDKIKGPQKQVLVAKPTVLIDGIKKTDK